MPVPAIVGDLVRLFETHCDAYRSQQYNEAQLRQEFINPLFHALGWDVYNEKRYADAYKEVIHEAAIKVGGRTKAPDYCFRAGGGKASFFVETKRPAVDISEDPSAAYQLRRYAWSAKLPVSILTDFEELAVYDCRIRPAKTDKPTTARILFYGYREYLDRWDELAGLFSPEAIRRGALDRFVASKKVKKGTAEVDAAFLAEIETWRDMLARNIALRNPAIAPRDLNFAVQRTIDRVVFLRICEDRGIEPYGMLQSLLNGAGVYPRLAELFERADDRYNSGLFHFNPEKDRAEPPDDLTLNLSVDDKPLQDILQGLYYPESPYEFSVLPAEILGQVYEQFLGKVIRLTKGHQAKVEEKPEVRKAGGVYYTPAYIVDYIVEHTLGKLLEGKSPAQAAKLRVLDPACGSGSFLIGAYQRLLDWHRDRYVEKDAEKHARGRSPKLYRGPAGEWRLTTAERKRILLNNIYGVDIDPQAVEVTKLSLLLKVLEGESKETVNNQLRLFHERALPDLGRNIKCGNSLIGPDFYQNRQEKLFHEEEMLRINAFDWHDPRHGFGEIMKTGGFDTVIGNPPYGVEFDLAPKRYLEQSLPAFRRNNEKYAAFLQKGVSLLREGGHLGFIVSSSFLLGPYFAALKEYLLRAARALWVVDFGLAHVFAQPDVFTCVTLVQRREKTEKPNASVAVARVEEPRTIVDEAPTFGRLSRKDASSLQWARSSPVTRRLVSSLPTLHEYCLVKDVGLNYWTIGRGKKRGGSVAERVLYTGKQRSRKDRPFLKGRDIDRFELRQPDSWLRHDWSEALDPTVDRFRFDAEFLCQEKIVYRQTADRPKCALDRDGYLTDKTVHSIVWRAERRDRESYSFLLGIMNSRLVRFLYQHSAREAGRTFAQVKVFRIRALPFRPIDFSDRADKARHDRMVELVEGMVSLRHRLGGARMEHEKTALQRHIETTDKQIDQLVYELFGLTDEEIQIVEEAMP
jgi:predicted type IV restriction endonuclease